jgi:hypothetical protein
MNEYDDIIIGVGSAWRSLANRRTDDKASADRTVLYPDDKHSRPKLDPSFAQRNPFGPSPRAVDAIRADLVGLSSYTGDALAELMSLVRCERGCVRAYRARRDPSRLDSICQQMVVRAASSSTPSQATHWSTRLHLQAVSPLAFRSTSGSKTICVQ